jgi:MerR family transcriptional regulator, redox-sensitive transcriptional activator SoxR
MSQEITIGELAKRSGVATSALRFYEDEGLIQSARNVSGHRRYRREVIRRVAFIVFAQRVGLSLEEVRGELAKVPGNRVPERSDWAQLSKGWTGASMNVSPNSSGCAQVSPSVSVCGVPLDGPVPAREPGDRAVRRGAGPRYWMGDTQ